MADRRSPWNPRSSRSAQAPAVSDRTAPSSSSSATPSSSKSHISNATSFTSNHSSSIPPTFPPTHPHAHVTAANSTTRAAPAALAHTPPQAATTARQPPPSPSSSSPTAIDSNKSQRYLRSPSAVSSKAKDRCCGGVVFLAACYWFLQSSRKAGMLNTSSYCTFHTHPKGSFHQIASRSTSCILISFRPLQQPSFKQVQVAITPSPLSCPLTKLVSFCPSPPLDLCVPCKPAACNIENRIPKAPRPFAISLLGRTSSGCGFTALWQWQ